MFQRVTRRTIQKVHETTEGENEEVKLLDQLPFSRRIVLAAKILNDAIPHNAALLQQGCLRETELKLGLEVLMKGTRLS